MMNDKKTILYVRTDVGTEELIGGGSVTHTLGILKGFLDHGYQVICVSSAMHILLKNMRRVGFSYIPLLLPEVLLRRLGFKLSCLISNFFFYHSIKKVVKDQRIDFIYQRYSMLNVVGVWLSRHYKVPLILEFNGSEVWVDEHWSQAKMRMRWLLRLCENYNIKRAHKVIVVSQALKDQLVAQGCDATKIEINPNGVDVEIFNPARVFDHRMAIRRELRLENKFVIGFAGTFGPWHGIELLGLLIPKVVKQNNKIHFLLMGDGPLKRKLVKTIHEADALDHVTFVGMLHAYEMPRYLAVCDAFVCPTQPNKDGSRFFGSPTKLFEYMAMGKPIVASDLEQLARVLDIPLCKRFLVPPHDVDQFQKVIMQLLTLETKEYYDIGYALQHKVEEYTWYAHIARIRRSIGEAQ